MRVEEMCSKGEMSHEEIIISLEEIMHLEVMVNK